MILSSSLSPVVFIAIAAIIAMLVPCPKLTESVGFDNSTGVTTIAGLMQCGRYEGRAHTSHKTRRIFVLLHW